MHNQVYVKRIDARRRRDTSEIFEIIKKRDHSYYSEVRRNKIVFSTLYKEREREKERRRKIIANQRFLDEENKKIRKETFLFLFLQKESTADKQVNSTYVVFEREVPSPNLSFVMKNLRHFAYYNIEVQACREVVKNDTNDTCSTKSMKTYRTLPLDSADNIPVNTFRLSISGENNSLTTVTLYWAEPPQPNGLIVTYQIEYKRVDIQNVSVFFNNFFRHMYVRVSSYVQSSIDQSLSLSSTDKSNRSLHHQTRFYQSWQFLRSQRSPSW